MRVITGSVRGRKLREPEGMDIRPTTDQVKEALFNIVQFDIEGRRVLDVFAGTGAFGLEALSRGAKEICLIDKDIALVLRNAALFENQKDKISIIKADVARLPKAKTSYDVIFSDAPYDKGLSLIALQSLSDNGYIKDGALCIIETRRNEKLLLADNFELIDERCYGMAKVWFFIFHFSFER